MAHLVQINTETDFPTDEGNYNDVHAGPFGAENQQLDWLDADRAAINRTKTPWVIVSGHRPWYSSKVNCTTCRSAFESMLLKHNVDVYWAGHVHYYERSVAISNGTVDPDGLNNPKAPLYLTNGGAGNDEGHSVPISPLSALTKFLDAENFAGLILHSTILHTSLNNTLVRQRARYLTNLLFTETTDSIGNADHQAESLGLETAVEYII